MDQDRASKIAEEIHYRECAAPADETRMHGTQLPTVLKVLLSRGLRADRGQVSSVTGSGWYHAKSTTDRATGEPRGPRWVRVGKGPIVVRKAAP